MRLLTASALLTLALGASTTIAQSSRRPSDSGTRPSPNAVVWTIDASQSSSLYLENSVPAAPLPSVGNRANNMSPGIAATSLMAVRLPEPRRFAVHDLVTIIIRESTDVDSSSEVDLKKQFDLNGSIKDFPALNLADLLQFQLRPSGAKDNPPKVGIETENKFKGEGDYKRKDSFTGRLTARIIDVKPNGALVLEARKYIENDDETLAMTLTGTCRKDDVAGDNTVLSTQLFDLRLVKNHSGELRKSSKKGLVPRFFEAIFNF